jgi:hypothetical protein
MRVGSQAGHYRRSQAGLYQTDRHPGDAAR